MGLSQIKPEHRIIFLEKFSAELLINSGEPRLIEEKIKKQIEVEKLRQKFFKPIEIQPKQDTFKEDYSGEGLQKSISSSFFQQPVYSKKTEELTEMNKVGLVKKRYPYLKKPIFQRNKAPEQIPVQRLRKSISTTSPQPATLALPPYKQMQPSIVEPEAQTRPENFDLGGKLAFFLKDSLVQSIECPGPGRNLLVKRNNIINTTRITLSQTEITTLINHFAQQARIPIVGGILKAAVGDLVISAVSSEFVGSRFIINKITPYSVMGI